MLKKLVQYFRKTMDSGDDYDLMDLLAYNCTNLTGNLNTAASEAEKQHILQKYLEKVDTQHESIEDFKEDLDWFNVTEPLTFTESLRGKIVILDFFTYCCINCMHVLPDLKKLEKAYTVEDGVVVIGVHSAKFENEKDSANILSAVQRYDITHPVVNDSSSSMWLELKIKCWPTLVILGPRANPLFVIMGEGHFDTIDLYVNSAIRFYKNQGALSKSSLPLNPSTDLIMTSQLKFPGKIVCSKSEADDDSAELFAISDSGNNRILIIDSNGNVLKKIGGKSSGFVDGDFESARFNSPQGLAFFNDFTVMVADTENHAIRKIDLKTRLVTTLVGTGKQGNDRVGGKIGKEQEISSPWDLVCHKTRDMDMSFHMDESTVLEKDVILIAMAGTHQIWGLFLDDVIWWKFKKFPAFSCAVIIGNGQEENRNNSYPQNASFAQPSGLAISKENKMLYVADSESSCVRKVSLSDGNVMPVVGGDRNPLNLFAFGDVDGKQFAAKLQHPLGVAYNSSEQTVYVADTYNHKIKRIDVFQNTVSTCAIKDSSGRIFQFNEPAGLCLNSTGEYLYVADTNNHSVEVVNLKSMKSNTLKLNFNLKNDSIKADHDLQMPSTKIKTTGGKIKLTISLSLEGDTSLTEGAPQSWSVYVPNEFYFVDKQNGPIKSDSKIDIDVTVPKSEKNKTGIINILTKLSLCSANACYQKAYSLKLPLVFDDDGLDCIIEDVCVVVSKNSIRVK